MADFPRPISPVVPAVHATAVVKEWETGPTLVRALRGVELEARSGEKVAILGKSGSGKSTLLNLLGGLDRPTAGRIEVCGRRLDGMTRDELARYRLEVVGMIFQSFHLVPSRTALGNVELPLVFAGVSCSERRARAEAALDAVGLSHRLHHRPTQLSGGEQQRVAFARALVNHPSLILADEPTGNLDSENAAAILELLETHLRRSSATMVLVTHDEELARRLSDRVLWMRDGTLHAHMGSA